MTLIWSPESIYDLISLRAHIAEFPAAAKRVALNVVYCVEHLLSENPQFGAPGRVPRMRELVIPKMPYIVPYRIHRMTIEIARVYHSCRRWPERLYRLCIPLAPSASIHNRRHKRRASIILKKAGLV
jgi:toxin ParE1/3/4